MSGVKNRTASRQCIIVYDADGRRSSVVSTVIREERVRSIRYRINGNEIGGGSVRIFDQDIQSKMFKVLGFTEEQAQEQFGFLLTAFKYGVPPHAGLAYGLDRLVMLMAKQDSIRDVIAFPKVKDASDLMTEAPGHVDAKQLEELGIAVVAKEEKKDDAE